MLAHYPFVVIAVVGLLAVSCLVMDFTISYRPDFSDPRAVRDFTFSLSFPSNASYAYSYTVEPLLRGHPDERPPPLERPLDNVNLNINILISTPDERPPLLKGHFSDAKGMASQEGFHCSHFEGQSSMNIDLNEYPCLNNSNNHSQT